MIGKRLLAVAIAGPLISVLVAAGVISLFFPNHHPGADRRIVVDQSAVHLWTTRTASGIADLNAVGDLPGLANDAPAHVTRCAIDSGDLQQMWAGRDWAALPPRPSSSALPDSVTASIARGFETLVDRLRFAGWTIVGRHLYLGMALPAGLTFDTADLERKDAGRDLTLTIQVFPEAVLASLYFDGAEKACHLAWQPT